jgi:hypothetical protein
LFRRFIRIFYSLANSRYRTHKTPEKRRPPKRENPKEKDLFPPMIPIPTAITPPLRRKPAGTVRETATLLIF